MASGGSATAGQLLEGLLDPDSCTRSGAEQHYELILSSSPNAAVELFADALTLHSEAHRSLAAVLLTRRAAIVFDPRVQRASRTTLLSRLLAGLVEMPESGVRRKLCTTVRGRADSTKRRPTPSNAHPAPPLPSAAASSPPLTAHGLNS